MRIFFLVRLGLGFIELNPILDLLLLLFPQIEVLIALPTRLVAKALEQFHILIQNLAGIWQLIADIKGSCFLSCFFIDLWSFVWEIGMSI